ncbi:SIR2 family protein [Symbioplanes lichenis]|uniref:SIR2 family protein n=1 Tax=Symbioplanes lichenis TaxID=1629072 RepID=UPI002738EEE1|nr:SIR2 family protein [Actinoplanes lichenis]
MSAGLPGVASAGSLFVFAGAGASFAMPAALPLFDPMRNDILRQLRLHEYVPGEDPHRPELERITEGLAPEPFMLALRESGVDVEGWLARTLRPTDPAPARPNAVHVALAQLAGAGAAVWTVNFDTLIEEADPSLRVVAWREAASTPGEIYKPHGSLPGPLIVTADAVLAGLRDDWRRALADAVRGRTVVFLGYSGRDFDFQPLWDDVLTDAARVIWFDRPSGDPEAAEQERARRRRLLRRCVERDALVVAESENPSVGFVAWCRGNGLVTMSDDEVKRLEEKRPERSFPPLAGDLGRAEASIRGILGDWHGAVRVNLRRLRQEPGRRQTAVDLVAQTVNNAGRWVTVPLWAVARTPVLPGRVRTVAERKRLTAHSRLGNHRQVLRGTRRTDETSLSTLLILRALSLRITGDLDAAAETAAEAHRRALRETNDVRVAHAAYQRAQALLWAERLAECRLCLDEELRPAAGLAAARWVAWADFIEAGIALHEGNAREAARHYELARLRFEGEGSIDGQVSVQTALLALCRMTDPGRFAATLATLETIRAAKTAQTATYFTRGHPFTDEAVLVERAEHARVHEGDLAHAARLYGQVAGSRYPLQRSLGLLGAGMIAVERGTDRGALTRARDLAGRIGARLVTQHATEALGLPSGERPREVFHC